MVKFYNKKIIRSCMPIIGTLGLFAPISIVSSCGDNVGSQINQTIQNLQLTQVSQQFDVKSQKPSLVNKESALKAIKDSIKSTNNVFTSQDLKYLTLADIILSPDDNNGILHMSIINHGLMREFNISGFLTTTQYNQSIDNLNDFIQNLAPGDLIIHNFNPNEATPSSSVDAIAHAASGYQNSKLNSKLIALIKIEDISFNTNNSNYLEINIANHGPLKKLSFALKTNQNSQDLETFLTSLSTQTLTFPDANHYYNGQIIKNDVFEFIKSLPTFPQHLESMLFSAEMKLSTNIESELRVNFSNSNATTLIFAGFIPKTTWNQSRKDLVTALKLLQLDKSFLSNLIKDSSVNRFSDALLLQKLKSETSISTLDSESLAFFTAKDISVTEFSENRLVFSIKNDKSTINSFDITL